MQSVQPNQETEELYETLWCYIQFLLHQFLDETQLSSSLRGILRVFLGQMERQNAS